MGSCADLMHSCKNWMYNYADLMHNYEDLMHNYEDLMHNCKNWMHNYADLMHMGCNRIGDGGPERGNDAGDEARRHAGTGGKERVPRGRGG